MLSKATVQIKHSNTVIDVACQISTFTKEYLREIDDIEKEINSLVSLKSQKGSDLLKKLDKELTLIDIGSFSPIEVDSSKSILHAVESIASGSLFRTASTIHDTRNALRRMLPEGALKLGTLLQNINCDYFSYTTKCEPITTGSLGVLRIGWDDFINNVVPSNQPPTFFSRSNKELALSFAKITVKDITPIEDILRDYTDFFSDLKTILGNLDDNQKLAYQAIDAWWGTHSPLATIIKPQIRVRTLSDTLLSTNPAQHIVVHGYNLWMLKFIICNLETSEISPHFSYLSSNRPFSGDLSSITVVV